MHHNNSEPLYTESLYNFSIQQHRIEYKTQNLNLRAYTSIEDAGNTHDLAALGGRIANAQPGGIAGGWAPIYLQNYFINLFGQLNANPIAALNQVLGGIMFYGDTSMYDYYFTPQMNYNAHAFARVEANKNMLVGEAINLMNTKKITSLFICDKKRPLGIVHIHDLLRLTS